MLAKQVASLQQSNKELEENYNKVKSEKTTNSEGSAETSLSVIDSG